MGRLLGHFVLACDRDDLGDGRMKLFIPGESGPRWEIPARGYGANGPGWWMTGGDTPPGRYRVGKIHPISADDPQANAFGPYFLDLIELEGQEMRHGRAGIGIHGGGSGLADPRAPFQGWKITHGCVRVQNDHLLRVVNTVLWVRKQQSLRREWYDYSPEENYVDFTMAWVDQL